jgi:dTDP-4-amino-4,6-dideoxygalactose transaminase
MINIAKPQLSQEEVRAVSEVLLSGKLAQGEKVAEFEKAFADFTGARHAVAVGNGTQALHAALLARGVQTGDEVITTPFSFISSATSIVHCGARPVFADIDPRTFNINVEGISELITPKTKAIMPVHLFGLPADLDELRKICDEKGLGLIQDSCQAHGASVNGKPIATYGDVSTYSFYPTKNMTTGEGGAVVTDDDKIAEQVRLLRHQGQTSRYEYAQVGFNYRMTEMAAAIGTLQLRKLPEWNKARIANAKYLDEALAGNEKITTPFVPEGYGHVYHQYTIRVQNRDEVGKRMRENGVGTGVYYPRGLHQLGPLAGYCDRSMPNTEKAANEVLSLPVHPALAEDELAKVAEVTLKYIG